MMPLKSKLATRNKQQDDQIDRVLKTLYCEGLEPHNHSLTLLPNLLDELDATIDISGGSRSYDAESFAIFLSGTSGNRYRITVNYRARVARLIAGRFNEIEFKSNPEETIGALMHPFRSLMDFEIHWYDARDGAWEGICIHERHDVPLKSWPVDLLVSTMLILSNDLRNSLIQSMNTLRSELRHSYPIAWFARQTSDGVAFEDVVKFVTLLETLQNAGDREEFLEISDAALGDMFNESGQLHSTKHSTGGDE
jgi:hypothetical protein